MRAQLFALLPVLSLAVATELMSPEAASAPPLMSMGAEAAPSAPLMMPASPPPKPSKGHDAAPAPPVGGGSYAAEWDQGGEAQQEGGDWQQGGGEAAMTITQTAESSSYTPQHGSGSEGKVTDLDSCMQMCQAKFGGGGMAPPSETGKGEQPPTPPAQGAAAFTHTIIVAPTQGVLRFVPFAVMANPGDKLHYIWGGNMHSVTQSDGQNVCNKSTTAEAFDSGVFNKSATFEQVVLTNASTPQFFYCKVGKHCASGMFGLINPPVSNVSNVSNDLTDQATKTSAPIQKSTAGLGGGATCQDSSMGCWIDKWAGGGKRQKQIHDGVKQKCASVPDAWAWGSKWDMSAWETAVVTKEVIIENVMYSRYMLATNPSMLDKAQPLPSNWTAPPDLNSFVVDNGAETASIGPACSTGSAPASGDGGASPSGDAQAAGAGTGGAGRLGVRLATIAAVGLGIGFFI